MDTNLQGLASAGWFEVGLVHLRLAVHFSLVFQLLFEGVGVWIFLVNAFRDLDKSFPVDSASIGSCQHVAGEGDWFAVLSFFG